MFLKLPKFHRKTTALESFFKKVQAFKSATLLKRDTNTGIFLCNFRNFLSMFFYRTPALVAPGNTIYLDMRFYGVVVIIHGGDYFYGLKAFEKLKYQARFKAVETSTLRILTGKKNRQIKLQRLQNVQIWAFGLLVQQINSL